MQISASVLAFDAYYRDLSHITMEERRLRNYDHPESLDCDLFAAHLAALKAGDDVQVPVYDFTTHTHDGTYRHVPAAPVVLVEGILLLVFQEIADLLDFTIFLDVPEDERLKRRVLRDTSERGRDVADVNRQFAATVAPMHDEFVQPSKTRADLIVDVNKDAFSALIEELPKSLRLRG